MPELCVLLYSSFKAFIAIVLDCNTIFSSIELALAVLFRIEYW